MQKADVTKRVGTTGHTHSPRECWTRHEPLAPREYNNFRQPSGAGQEQAILQDLLARAQRPDTPADKETAARLAVWRDDARRWGLPQDLHYWSVGPHTHSHWLTDGVIVVLVTVGTGALSAGEVCWWGTAVRVESVRGTHHAERMPLVPEQVLDRELSALGR